jgi:hypothetical protein
MHKVVRRCQLTSIVKHLHQLTFCVLAGIVPIEYVGPYVTRKKYRFLLYDRYLLMVPLGINRASVNVVKGNTAELWSVELLNQRDD